MASHDFSSVLDMIPARAGSNDKPLRQSSLSATHTSIVIIRLEYELCSEAADIFKYPILSKKI